MRLVSDDVWAVMTIWCEARGEPYEGKVAIGEVIRNRAYRHYASDGTTTGTVLRAYQFSCWNTQDQNRIHASVIDDSDATVQDCVRAWQEAKNGSNLTNGAVLYYNPQVIPHPPGWAIPSNQTAVIGNHAFYTAS